MSFQLAAISDEFMQQALVTTRAYTIALLRKGPAYDPPRTDAIVWEHGRRNFQFRAAGVMCIICPISDGTDMAGILIFDADPPEVERIMADDPAVKAGVLVYEIHAARSFPGDCLRAVRSDHASS